MNALRYLLVKEFKQIFRNKSILALIFVSPIIQLIILPLAADYEIKNIHIAIVDHDRSTYSEKLTQKILSSGYFKSSQLFDSYKAAYKAVEKDEADIILEIPFQFEDNFIREQSGQFFVAINAINGAKAAIGGAYLSKIIGEYNQEIRLNFLTVQRYQASPVIEITVRNWYNQFLDYQVFMVPGILSILITTIGVYMCSLNIVKEKETGTIEQINVTPIKKQFFILGKLIPFWIIGLVVFSIGLFVVAYGIYGIRSIGSLLLLYVFLGLYLIAVIGIGLLISTYSQTQQQAMSLAFFCMMILILMGGLFTSIDSMPEWAQWIARFNPISYFIEVTRMVIMKGSKFQDIQQHFMIMLGFALFFNTWAVLNYRKTI